MPTTFDVLTEARRLIAEKGWTRRYFARDEEGEEVHPCSPQATCFCAVGAIQRAAFEGDEYAKATPEQ